MDDPATLRAELDDERARRGQAIHAALQQGQADAAQRRLAHHRQHRQSQ